MSICLVIPDIHEDLSFIRKVDQMADLADSMVCLGDYFDTHKSQLTCSSPEKPWHIAVCEWIVSKMPDPKWDWRIGNHDTQYLYPAATWTQCSGYQPHKTAEIQRLLLPFRERFKLTGEEQGWELSHAGWHPFSVGFKTEAQIAHAFELLRTGGIDPLFGAGRSRGGHQAVGGPTWLDWIEEFQDVSGMKQIVGHTGRRKMAPMSPGGSWCIDENQRRVGWIEDGIFRVEDV